MIRIRFLYSFRCLPLSDAYLFICRSVEDIDYGLLRRQANHTFALALRGDNWSVFFAPIATKESHHACGHGCVLLSVGSLA